MFDCHVHTGFSTDCCMNIEDAIKVSKDKEIGLIITEHMDLGYPKPEEFIFDIEEYFNTYNKYKSDRLLLGMELGMNLDYVEEGKKLCERDFDMIIGSLHMLKGFDIYEGDLYEGRSKKDVFESYFKYMYDCVKSYDYIDTMGHIDFISRYANYSDREIRYENYADLIDEVLKVLAKNEKSIEINTRRFNDKTAVDNLTKIYKRFYELGGRTATIGSDAHLPESVGNNLELGYEMAKECLLKPVYFKERRIYYI